MKNLGLVKLIVCGVLSVIAFWFARKFAIVFIGTDGFIKTALAFAVTVASGGLVYLVGAVVLKVNEAQTIIKTLGGFIKPLLKKG